jgi:hypothetical protein
MTITKLCRTPEEVIVKHLNPNIRGTGKEGATHRKYKRLKLGGDQAYNRSFDRTRLYTRIL